MYPIIGRLRHMLFMVNSRWSDKRVHAAKRDFFFLLEHQHRIACYEEYVNGTESNLVHLIVEWHVAPINVFVLALFFSHDTLKIH